MDWLMTLGFVAGGLGTISFAPQVYKTLKTKSAGDLSFGMLTLLCATNTLWAVYGFFRKDIPLVATNFSMFSLVFTVLVCKLKFKR